MDNATHKLPFPIVNNSVRDMRVRLALGDGFVDVSIPSGGRIVLVGVSGNVKLDVTLGGLDEIPPHSASELHINDVDAS